MLEFNTLNSITTEIAAHLEKELDEPFKRLLAQAVDNWRSRLLRNSLQDKPNESKFFRQTLYIPLIKASQLPDCLEGPDLCPVRISSTEIPRMVRYGISYIDYIGSIDGNVPFSDQPPGQGQYLTAGKYASKTIYYSLINRYVRVYNHPNLPSVRLDGVFENAYEVMMFNCNAGVGCDYWDLPYPATGDIVQMIVQAVVESFKTAPTDKDVEVSPQKQTHEPDGK